MDKENSWLLLSETPPASERLEPSSRKNKSEPRHCKWSFKKSHKISGSSDCIQPSSSLSSCWSGFPLKRVFPESGIIVRTWPKFSATSSWPLRSSSLLFLKASLWQSLCLLPSQSRRCSMIRIWSERWKPAKPWAAPTTYVLIKPGPWLWTKWLWRPSGMAL